MLVTVGAQVREARVARASSQFQAGAQGMSGSSVLGADANISSQLSGNLGFMNQTGQAAEQASIFGQQAADANSAANTANAVSSIFSSGAKLAKPAGK